MIDAPKHRDRAQGALFAAEPRPPAGFLYREEMIGRGDEHALVEQLRALPFKPFEFHGYLGNRRIVAFGWRYDYSARGLRASEPIPPFLLPLRRVAGDFAGIAENDLQQVLVTEYALGAGIGWHRDKPMFEDVIAFSLLAPCTLRLRLKRGDGWERYSEMLQPRSAYLLRGAARSTWEHSIPPLEELRYSITFRDFRST